MLAREKRPDALRPSPPVRGRLHRARRPTVRRPLRRDRKAGGVGSPAITDLLLPRVRGSYSETRFEAPPCLLSALAKTVSGHCSAGVRLRFSGGPFAIPGSEFQLFPLH